jgi:DNA-binding beta-propeller fold protein YncE
MRRELLMRRTVALFTVLVLAAWAHPGRSSARGPSGPLSSSAVGQPLARAVIDSFPPPGAEPRGLDWDADAGVLYHCDDGDAGGTVYSITPEGDATLLFSVPAQTGYKGAGATGICHVRDDSTGTDYLYVTDYGGSDETSDIVYQFTPDGTLIDEFPLMGIDPICSGVVGIAFDGRFFWLTCQLSGEVVKCDREFAAVDTFFHPVGGFGGGMDYDPETGLLYMTDFFEGDVYVTDRTLQILDEFPAHPTAFQMVGIAVGRTGRDRTLWTASYRAATRYIYEIDDEYYNSPVERVRWGTIKSLYR